MSACSSFPELREAQGIFPELREFSLSQNSEYSGSLLQARRGRFTPKIAPLEALQWLNGPIDTKSAQSLTGSSLQCSEAWICTNISSSSYPSNLCTLIRLIKGNRPQNIFRGRQIISFISIAGPQTNLFLSDNSSWSGYKAQESSSGPSDHLVYAPCYGGNAWQDTNFSCDLY